MRIIRPLSMLVNQKLIKVPKRESRFLMNTDVVVIGAGAAGLAAARRLHERNVNFLLLEARDRVGGRAYTVDSSTGFPIELGAEFVHGTPEVTFSLLRECGEEAVPLTGANDAWDVAEAIIGRVDVHGTDRSVEAFLASLPRDLFSADDLEATRMLVEGFDAAITSDASVIGIAKEWRGDESSASFRPSRGYRPIMEHLAQQIEERLLLNARVERVEWDSRGVRVRVQRDDENLEITARRAIVTLPIGVLRRQSVTFSPELPLTMRRAIDAIAMGPVVRVAMEFHSAFWETVERGRYRDVRFYQAPQMPVRVLWTQLPDRVPLLVAWAGGGAALRIAREHLDPIEASLATVQTLFPSVDVRAELRKAYVHDWQADPFACGAYSYLRVNGGDARDELWKPIEQTLFMAGEATSSSEPGTVAGALQSGYRAALLAIEAIDNEVRHNIPRVVDADRNEG